MVFLILSANTNVEFPSSAKCRDLLGGLADSMSCFRSIQFAVLPGHLLSSGALFLLEIQDFASVLPSLRPRSSCTERISYPSSSKWGAFTCLIDSEFLLCRLMTGRTNPFVNHKSYQEFPQNRRGWRRNSLVARYKPKFAGVKVFFWREKWGNFLMEKKTS